jgi:hypothetical protein
MLRAGTAAPELIDRDWSRQDILDYLSELADTGTRALIGLDLSPSFPFQDEGAYFPGWEAVSAGRTGLWKLVDTICAGDPHLSATSFVAIRRAAPFPPAGRLRRPVSARPRPPAGLRAWPGGDGTVAVQLLQPGRREPGRQIEPDRHARAQPPARPRPGLAVRPGAGKGPVIVEIYTSLAARLAGMRKGISKIRDGATLDVMLAAFGSKPHAAARPLRRSRHRRDPERRLACASPREPRTLGTRAASRPDWHERRAGPSAFPDAWGAAPV